MQCIGDVCYLTLFLNKSQLSGHPPGGEGAVTANAEFTVLPCLSQIKAFGIPQLISFHKPESNLNIENKPLDEFDISGENLSPPHVFISPGNATDFASSQLSLVPVLGKFINYIPPAMLAQRL